MRINNSVGDSANGDDDNDEDMVADDYNDNDDNNNDDNNNIVLPTTLKSHMWNEACSVSAWAVVVLLLRMGISLLRHISSSPEKETCEGFDVCGPQHYAAPHPYYGSALARGLLSLLPTKIATDKAPGFWFASPWILSGINNMFGAIPSVPVRICEMRLGRLSLRELAILLPIHFVCALLVVKAFQLALPEALSSLAIAPVLYSDEGQWQDFVSEVLVHVIFTVFYLVLPELLSLNKFPLWLIGFVMYPVFCCGVDADGMASTLAPDLLYALDLGGGEVKQLARLVASLVGSFIGGEVMSLYFPDDPP